MNTERETKMHTCKRGHTTEVHRMPCGKWLTCRECNREKNKAYREANREKDLERKKAYREANREKVSERMKAWREAVKQLAPDDEIKLNRKAYNKAYMKAYYEANRERLAALSRERRKRAKEKREHGDK